MSEAAVMATEKQAVPQGYKQTEVGVIPEDWEVLTIGDIAEVKTGPFGSVLHEKDYVQDGTPIITVEHLGELGLTYQNLPMVSDFDQKRLRAYQLYEGDIVFSRVGSIDRNALITSKENGWLFSGRLLRVKLKSSNNIPKYISYHFHTDSFKKRVAEVAVGQTMPSLNTKILKGIFVVVPKSKKEQTAIANALSDMDALLTELEQLIAKKQAIKTATMQQLLTGKTRLPQFATYTEGEHKGQPKGMKPSELGEIPEDWEVSPLKDLTVMMTNGFVGTAKTHYVDSSDGVLYIQGYNVEESGINYHGIKRVSQEFHKRQSKSSLKEGDVLMVQTGDVGLCTTIPKELTNSNCHALIISRFKLESYDPRFFCYLLNSKAGRLRLKDLEVGSTMKHINVGDLLSFLVQVPINQQEQTTIANILSDMDAEIQALKQRLVKTRQIKQGMMQELLTGKTRLPIEADD